MTNDPVPTTTMLMFTLSVELDFPLTLEDAKRAGKVFADQLAPIVHTELSTGGAHPSYPAGPDATPAEIRRSQSWGYGRAMVLSTALTADPAAPSSTPNGYDPRWVEAINEAMLDRETGRVIEDVTQPMWDRFIGPLLDAIETGEVSS